MTGTRKKIKESFAAFTLRYGLHTLKDWLKTIAGGLIVFTLLLIIAFLWCGNFVLLKIIITNLILVIIGWGFSLWE